VGHDRQAAIAHGAEPGGGRRARNGRG
jgi:hypothetical protein